MHWTTDKPTQPGLYWFRVHVAGRWCEPNIIWTNGVNQARHFMGMVGDVYLTNMHGQFAGPLTPPRDGGEDE